MRITINLATRPFVELRPLYARLRLAMVALAVLGIALGVGLHFLNQQALAAKGRMDALQAKTRAFQNERAANEARMRQPANRAVLDRSKFLNGVFARKSFSWTSVMMDLERVLPTGVQVTSIEPVIAADGGVSIRLRVSGDREKAVDLVRNLERSQRFLAPRLAAETAQTQEKGNAAVVPVGVPGGVEFDILSGYNPLPETAAKVPGGAKPAAVVKPHVAAGKGKQGAAAGKGKGIAPAPPAGSEGTGGAAMKQTMTSTVQGVSDRTRGWVTPLNLHFAGLAVLLLLNVYLLAEMGLAWQAKRSRNAAALADQTVQLKTAEIAARPLEGLDAKLDEATSEADRFYAQRLPGSVSEVVAELGGLAKKEGVRLTRVGYGYAPALAGSAGEVTEDRIDASLSGDYRPLVQFVNALERDKKFFVIYNVVLTGQQSGTVNLRLRLTTYLRGRAQDQIPGEAAEEDAGADGSPADRGAKK